MAKVNILGVNGFGQTPKSGLHPAAGAVLSLGVGAGATYFAGTRPKLQPHADLFGGAVAAGASGLLMISERTRAAGFTGLAVAVVNAGIRYMLKKKDDKGVSGAFGIVSAQNVPTLGAVAAYRMPTLGAVTAQRVPTLGTVAVEPRQLAGGGALPTFNGLAGHFGATCMG